MGTQKRVKLSECIHLIATFPKKRLLDCKIETLQKFVKYKLKHLSDDYTLFIDDFNSLYDDDSLLLDEDEFQRNELKQWSKFCDELRNEKEDWFSEWP